MKKVIYALVGVLCVVALALPFLRVDKTIPFNDMNKQVIKLADNADFKKQDEVYIRKQYELNKSEYEDIVCYGVPSAMEVNEFSVVHVSNGKKRDYVMNQLQKRIDRQYTSFSGYAPRQAQLLKKAVLYQKGEYVIMIIHKDAQNMKDAINALF